MATLYESSAFLDMERLLPQHQAALTLLQGMLSDPTCRELSWLDLACGKGQIIAHLNNNLSNPERKKIRLVGYDIENAYSKHAKRIAESMDMASFEFVVGELNRYWENSATQGPWQFITLTNTIHEIFPASLPEIFARSIDRLSDDGCLFIYDMERLSTPELGAVTWTASEIKTILRTLCIALGCATTYEPAVGSWCHKTCNGWNAQLRRSHMRLPADYHDNIVKAVQVTSKKILDLLNDRLARVNSALESLAEYGPETGEEAANQVNLLNEYWAVSQALGGQQ